MADETISNLLVNSEEFRNKLLAKNKELYTEGSEYKTGHPNSISDGDEKGRDPEDEGGSIGTSIDIQKENALTAKNKYNCNNEYAAGSCFNG